MANWNRIVVGSFSLAPDFYISIIFYAIVTVNCALYVPNVASTFLEKEWEKNSYLQVFYFYYLPILLAFVADVFLTMTLIGDPGIIIRKEKDPERHAVKFVTAQDVMVANRKAAGGMHSMSAGSGSDNNNPNHGIDQHVDNVIDGQAQKCVPTSEMLDREEIIVKEGIRQTLMKPETEDDLVDCHFCPVCKCYVEYFDHHCAVIGACIGRYTMGTFILFLLFAMALCIVGFFPSAYRAYLDMSTWDFNRPPQEFATAQHICSFIGIACGAVGGNYCAYLGFHYYIFAYQGKNSLQLRRKWLKKNWNDISVVERYGGHPIQGYIRPGAWANVKLVFRDMKFWRLSPVTPVREL